MNNKKASFDFHWEKIYESISEKYVQKGMKCKRFRENDSKRVP